MSKNYFSNILIFLISLLWLVPIVTTLLVAFKTRKEYLNQLFYELPNTVAFFNNFIILFNYSREYVNSLWSNGRL